MSAVRPVHTQEACTRDLHAKGAQRSSAPSDAEPRTLDYLLVRENEWGRIYSVGYYRVLGTGVDFASRYDVILTALNQSH